uniref:Amino acid transporter transmembrane domain-containing protein n=1 Tax=Percolomonas cosmopolitus TaxID=63605 RepID=A0A7S1KM07_9EUKA|mmetsp:Transcript_11628/g.43698  ORF Transcript_11628/g.43698 Transcript_11628/m.43698 type:complete len:526 (+) Transcript_11628:35-1612(+)
MSSETTPILTSPQQTNSPPRPPPPRVASFSHASSRGTFLRRFRKSGQESLEFLGAWFNMAKSFNGAGLFSMPWAMAQAGLLAGVISLFLFAYIAYYTMSIIVKMRRYVQCQEQFEQRSKYWRRRRLRRWEKRAGVVREPPQWQSDRPTIQYDDLVQQADHATASADTSLNAIEGSISLNSNEEEETSYMPTLYDREYIFSLVDLGWEAMGHFGEFGVYFNVMVGNIGVCTIFFVLTCDVLNQLVPEISNRLWMLFLLPVLVVMSWIRTPRFLASFSIVGLIFLLLGLCTVLSYGFVYRIDYLKWPWQYGQSSWINIKTFPLFFGTASFLFNTHPLVLPIEQSMSNRKHYQWTLRLAFFLGLSFNLVFATMAFLFWGDSIEGNATNNLPTSWFLSVVRVTLVMELVLTYGLVLMPVVVDIDSQILYPIKKRSRVAFYSLSTLMRTFCVLLTGGFAVIFANKFSYVVAFVGAICPNLVGWTLPSLFYLCLMRHRMNIVTFLWNEFVVIFGIFTMCACVYITILGFLD